MIVSSAPFFGPLKRVIGEPTLIGACSGNLTTAVPKPSPTIASPQALRAVGTSVAISLPLVHTPRPVVSSAPCLSNSSTKVSRIGGRSPERVESFPPPWVTIGAFSCFGSAFGAKPPSASSTRFPTTRWTLKALAVAAVASKPSTTSPATIFFFIDLFPSRFPNTPRYRRRHKWMLRSGGPNRAGGLCRRDELREPTHPLLDLGRAQPFERVGQLFTPEHPDPAHPVHHRVCRRDRHRTPVATGHQRQPPARCEHSHDLGQRQYRLLDQVEGSKAANRVEGTIAKGQLTGVATDVGDIAHRVVADGDPEHRRRGVDADDEALPRRQGEVPGEVPRPAGDVEDSLAGRDREHRQRDPVLLLGPRPGQPHQEPARHRPPEALVDQRHRPAPHQPLRRVAAGLRRTEQVEVAALEVQLIAPPLRLDELQCLLYR